MKIIIKRSYDGDNIEVFKDFDDCKDAGEISHFITELELLKLELLDKWEDF